MYVIVWDCIFALVTSEKKYDPEFNIYRSRNIKTIALQIAYKDNFIQNETKMIP